MQATVNLTPITSPSYGKLIQTIFGGKSTIFEVWIYKSVFWRLRLDKLWISFGTHHRIITTCTAQQLHQLPIVTQLRQEFFSQLCTIYEFLTFHSVLLYRHIKCTNHATITTQFNNAMELNTCFPIHIFFVSTSLLEKKSWLKLDDELKLIPYHLISKTNNDIMT